MTRDEVVAALARRLDRIVAERGGGQVPVERSWVEAEWLLGQVGAWLRRIPEGREASGVGCDNCDGVDPRSCVVCGAS